jgi:hypothetical protein
MAKGSTFSSGGGSTIVQPVGSQTRPTISQRAIESFRREFFTVKDLEDPERLYQVVYQLQTNAQRMFHILATNPIGGGNLVQGLIFTAGQTLNVQHGLGRDYIGYFCTRAQNGYPAFQEAPLPASVTRSQVLPVTAQNAGTFDLYIF